MPRRSSTGSLAVPMSIPRYSCMASAFTISAPSRLPEGIGGPVDLRAQVPAESERGAGLVVATGDADPHAGVGPGQPPHPAGQQRAHREFGGPVRVRRQLNRHLDTEAGEGAAGVRAEDLVGATRSD